MGNRAVVTTPDKNLALYLHWNGGRDTVEQRIKPSHELSQRRRDTDADRLCLHEVSLARLRVDLATRSRPPQAGRPRSLHADMLACLDTPRSQRRRELIGSCPLLRVQRGRARRATTPRG